MVRTLCHSGWLMQAPRRRACVLPRFGIGMFIVALLLPDVAGGLHAQEDQATLPPVALPEVASPTKPADEASPLSSRPKIIIIETTPDIERTEVIRQVVEALEKDGKAMRSEVDRVGKPVALEAILSPVYELPQEKIVNLIETLQSLGIDRMMFRVNREQAESSVIVNCPADITWRKVRAITEELERLGDFKVDVRVAANDDPVSPVPTRGAELAVPEAAAPHAVQVLPLKVFALRTIQADHAARIIEQLYIENPGGHDSFAIRLSVDDRTNSLIVRGDEVSLNEVETLLLRLDAQQPMPSEDDHQASGSKDVAGLRIGVPALGPTPKAFDSAIGDGDAKLFSFNIGLASQTVSDLRQQYDALEQQARSLSDQLRTPLPDPATGEKLKAQLLETVRQAFEARQKLQRSELAEFSKRLQGIQQSIDMREKISEQIIEHRVQELLDPNLKWNSRTPASQSSGIIESEWPVPVIIDSQSSLSTDSDHHDVTKELSREEAIRSSTSGASRRRGRPSFETVDSVQYQLWGSLGISCKPEVFFSNPIAGAAQGSMRVTQVRPGSPAALSDIRINDFILSTDTTKSARPANLLDQWRDSYPERSLKLKIQSGDRLLEREVQWPKDSVDPGVSGEWQLQTISGKGILGFEQGLSLELAALPTNEAGDSYGIWTLPRGKHADPMLVKMNHRTQHIDLGAINDRGELGTHFFGIWKREADELHVAFAGSSDKTAQRPTDFDEKKGTVQIWKRKAPDEKNNSEQALESPDTNLTEQPPDDSRHVVTLSPLAHSKSAQEFHELLAQRAEQVRQLREHIKRYEANIADGKDVEDSRRSLENVRRDLEVYSRKQKLAWEEYEKQLILLRANSDLELSRQQLAEEKLKELNRLVKLGLVTDIKIQEAKLRVQETHVAKQQAEASFEVYEQAGEGLSPAEGNHVNAE